MEGDIAEGLSSLSVIFGVAVFHIGASHRDVKTAIESKVAPKTQDLERAEQRRYIWNTIVYKSLPSLLMLIAICFVMIPKFIEHLISYSFELWNFKFTLTLYQILFIIVCFYLAVSISDTYRLLNKIMKMY